MERTRRVLRTGAWLTRERVRLVAAAVLIASAAGFLYWSSTAHGGIDLPGPAARHRLFQRLCRRHYVLDGNARAPFDLSLQYAREQQIFGRRRRSMAGTIRRIFFSSPGRSLMPYGLALAVWQAVSLGLYLLAIRASSPSAPGCGADRRAGRSRLAFSRRVPGGADQFGHGQNGFLTAALFGRALAMLDRGPLLAGILFGLLVYKPQYGLMIPLVLVASGRWRCFAAAAATVALLSRHHLRLRPAGLAGILGLDPIHPQVALEQGDTGWYKIQSVFCLGADVGRAHSGSPMRCKARCPLRSPSR